MSIRRSLLALSAVAVFGVAACSTGSSTSPATSPSLAAPAASASLAPASTMPSATSAPLMSPSAAAPSSASGAAAGGLTGFCADFQAQFAATWPNVDPALATTLVTKVQEWANDGDLAEIQPDMATIAGWLPSAATTGSLASPPSDVVTAMTNIKTFADTKCQS